MGQRMTATEAFALSEPTEEDLNVIEQAWKNCSARYDTRKDDIWYRTLAAPTPAAAREFATTWYARYYGCLISAALVTSAWLPAASVHLRSQPRVLQVIPQHADGPNRFGIGCQKLRASSTSHIRFPDTARFFFSGRRKLLHFLK